MVDFHQLEAGLDQSKAALIAGDLQSVEGLAAGLEAALEAEGGEIELWRFGSPKRRGTMRR